LYQKLRKARTGSEGGKIRSLAG